MIWNLVRFSILQFRKNLCLFRLIILIGNKPLLMKLFQLFQPILHRRLSADSQKFFNLPSLVGIQHSESTSPDI
jgi:hypothetical protein